MILRLQSPISPEERLEQVIAQLDGLASMQTTGFGPNKVLSVPDGVSKVLDTLLGAHRAKRARREAESELVDQAIHGPLTTKKGSSYSMTCPSCGNSTAVRAEGCFKCVSCGFSQC